ncbi:hypothetical protein HY622_00650 [Candidatus Uhrbacteria bacterium]|nr:hypothetical protein [Candidatus Uhrbacteria bacterium]
MLSSDLEHAIAKTIAFFDVFSYPVSLAEIRDFLLQGPGNVSTADIIDALRDSSFLADIIACERGYYLLRTRQDLVGIRNQRYRIAEKKYGRALKAVQIIARVPFVRLISVVNSLAMSNADDQSDIDLFIAVQPGHVWTVRFIVTALLDIMGLRPKNDKKKDAICASFFASTDSYNMVGLQIADDPVTGLGDSYLAWWVSRCIPLYDEGGEGEKFFQANEWAASLFPYRRFYLTGRLRRVSMGIVSHSIKKSIEWFLALCGEGAERAARAIQWKILPKALREIVNSDTRVVMTDSILKFHQNDTRSEIRDQFIATCKKYGIRF